MTQIIIIEDSSRYDLGGGQRITLEAINCLTANDNNILSLYDLGSGSQFSARVHQHRISCKFFGIKNTFSFFYKAPVLAFEILRTIRPKKKFFLYPTTKKALILSIVIKLIYTRGVIVFHQHSRMGFIFDSLKILARTVIIPGAIKKTYSRNIVVIQNPVNIIKSKNRCMVNDKVVIGFIGSLTQHKGFDLFVEAQKLNKLRATIAGQGPLDKMLRQESNLVDLGYIEGEQKENFYKSIDILIFPSVVEEAFSLVCFEAMFNYIPVVCFDIGYPSIIINNYNVGVVAKSFTVRSLNMAIEECIKNIEIYSANCNKVIRDFEGKDFCKELSAVFV